MQLVLERSPASVWILSGKRHVAASLVLATLLSLYLVAGLSLTSIGVEVGAPALARAVPFTWRDSRSFGFTGPPPVPEPLSFQKVAPLDALAQNAAIPVSAEPNPAARPFVFHATSELDGARALDCLTAAVYYEAAIETSGGQRAVAQVVLNRLRHPAFPKTVCGVVFQGSERSTGCQFTFTCDGALARMPSEAGWGRARKIAQEALAGHVYKPVGYATHYHTNWVVPYWSSSLTKVANVGTHIFYRWEGGWGRPAAFRYAHLGAEPDVGSIRRLSSPPATDSNEANTLLAMDSDLAIGRSGSPDQADFANRAVVRRYEPLRQQAAAAGHADLARAEVAPSLRWALTGETTAQPGAPSAATKSGEGATVVHFAPLAAANAPGRPDIASSGAGK